MKEAIEKRRSIRKFREGVISDDQMEILMKAAQLAPSASNNQPYKFIVVKNKELIKRLQRTSSIQDFVAGATVIFVGVVFPGYEKWNKVNLGIAIQHIFLQAVELGLGACWIGAFNEEKVKKILKIPQDMNVVALLPIGFPAEDPPARPRKTIDELFCIDQYEG